MNKALIGIITTIIGAIISISPLYVAMGEVCYLVTVIGGVLFFIGVWLLIMRFETWGRR